MSPNPHSEPAPYPRSVLVLAAICLFLYAGLSLLVLLAFVSVAFDPWTWKSILVLVCALAAAVDGALLLFRRATQAHIAGGLTVMALSTLRVGDPWDWNWASWTILIVTLLLSVPLIRALFVMREIDRMTA
jgi:hypothetical protein